MEINMEGEITKAFHRQFHSVRQRLQILRKLFLKVRYKLKDKIDEISPFLSGSIGWAISYLKL